ncbi:hypothetical protein BKA70DRAFT_1314903 [Coprinopsis sp. MPI-PUGE-AT-0042]|nr:hypothetical protein BKA70DRAFT_1314903 [Coprinopsis sp. MPI-PUGE-AT-0042]
MDFKAEYGVEGPLPERPGVDYFVTLLPKAASKDDVSTCCFFIAAFTQTLQDPSMKNNFLLRWVAYFKEESHTGYFGSDPSVVMGQTVLSRLSQIRMSNELETWSAISTWKNLAQLEGLLVNLAEGTLYSQVSDVHPLIAYLEKADYLYHFTHAILTISNRTYADDLRNGFRDPAIPLALLLLQTHDNMVQRRSLARRPRENFRSLLRGGSLCICANSADSIPRYSITFQEMYGDKGRPFPIIVTEMIYLFGSSGIAYPATVGRAVLRARKSVPDQGWKAIGQAMTTAVGPLPAITQNPQINWVEEFNAKMEYMVKQHSTSMKVLKHILCDNANHAQCSSISRASFGRSARLKECSSCHTAVYCSSECQREDWTRRHSLLCHEFRQRHRDMLKQETTYPHRVRAWHISLLRHTYAEDKFYLHQRLSSSASDVAVKDLTHFPIRTHVVSFGTFLSAWEGEPDPYALLRQHFQEEFLDWTRSRPPVDHTDARFTYQSRLVEGLFPFGTRVVRLTIKLATILPKDEDFESQVHVIDSFFRTTRQ